MTLDRESRRLTPEEHIAESKDAALTADRLFNENRPLQGAEMIWCSVKHAINAIAVQRGWRFSNYGQKKEVVRQMEMSGYPDLLKLLSNTQRLHAHSDSGFLETGDVEESRELAAVLRVRLIAIAESRT